MRRTAICCGKRRGIGRRRMDDLIGVKGVKFAPPPSHLLPSIQDSIAAATAQSLEEGDMAIVAVADRKGGWNAALVVKAPHGVNVETWIGSKWGDDESLNYGARVSKVIRLK